MTENVLLNFKLNLETRNYFFVRSFRYTASSYRNGYLDFKMYRGGGRRGLWLGGGEGREKYGWGGGRKGEKNRGTVITSLQLAFTERVVPATQAFDWSLDNRC